MVYPIVTKLGKQFIIRMLAHLPALFILNFGHVTITALNNANLQSKMGY